MPTFKDEPIYINKNSKKEVIVLRYVLGFYQVEYLKSEHVCWYHTKDFERMFILITE